MLKDIATLLPLPIPFQTGPISLGVAVAVIIRLRKVIFNVLMNLKNRDYSPFDVAFLFSPLIFATGTLFSEFLPLDLTPYLPPVLGLYLLLDALLGKNVPRRLEIGESSVLSFMQGFLLPRSSTLSFLFPALLARDVRWTEALHLSLGVALVYLLGSFIRPVVGASTLLGFLLALFSLALLESLGRYPLRFQKAVYGTILILLNLFIPLGKE